MQQARTSFNDDERRLAVSVYFYPMAPPITTLHIQGFKSLVDVQLQPRQLNIFIGKPNVGKSNILEALSLLGAGYSRGEKFMGEFIRYEKANQLFVDGVPTQPMSVFTNAGEAKLWPTSSAGIAGYAVGPLGFADFVTSEGLNRDPVHIFASNARLSVESLANATHISIFSGTLHLQDGRLSSSGHSFPRSIVRKYTFSPSAPHNRPEFGHLSVPHGENLFQVIRASKRMRQETAALFAPNKHQFVLEMGDDTLKTQKNLDGDVYSYPYSLIADTFQRLIFYLAAIESNEGSVLLFEEPEVSSFPPYTAKLADHITADVVAGRNQYFLTTHSPYLFGTLVENTPPDQLGVFIVYYEDYQTKIRQVTDEQLGAMLDQGGDVFFNLDQFLGPQDVF